MDKPLAKPEEEIWNQRILWMVLAVLVASFLLIQGFYQIQASDPFVKSVFSLRGNRDQGHAIFQINCAGCHGLSANGKVGPNLHGVAKRKSRFGIIQQVISGQTPPMPQFQPTSQEMADLLRYLESL